MHKVKCSGDLPTPMGIVGWVRPCRRAEAAHRTPHGKRVAAAERNGSPHAPWKAGGRSGTKRSTLNLGMATL
ncbi:hypothetical protein ABER02_22995 [Rossellomorea marisflavi]|uniref:hypothetical protein n=1 Tax=Rossellomorea marisflavi TaxID=189381 RepID=UPI003D2E32A8